MIGVFSLAMLLAATACAVLQSEAPSTPHASGVSASGCFLIVDPDAGEAVGDEFPGAIFRFDPVTHACTRFATDSAFIDPQDVVAHPDGSLYVVDFGAHTHEISSAQGRIHHLDGASGRLLRTFEPPRLRGPTALFLLTPNLLLIGDRAANIEPGGHSGVFLLDLTTGYLQIAIADDRFRVPAAFARDLDGSLLMLDADAKSAPDSPDEGVIFRIDPYRGTARVVSALQNTISPLGLLVLADGDFLIFDCNADPKHLGAPIGALFRHHRETNRTELIAELPRFRDPVRGAFGPDGRVWFVDANADPENRGPDRAGRGQNLTGPGAVFTFDPQSGQIELIASPEQFVNPTGILWRP